MWHFDSGKPGRNVMVSALVHGNELCGAWALKGLLEAGVRPSRAACTLAFCNLAAFDRFDAHHHDASRFVNQDLNRQWLDERMDAGDSSERYSRGYGLCAAGRLLPGYSLHARALGAVAAHRHPAAQPGAGAGHAAPEHIVVGCRASCDGGVRRATTASLAS